MIRYDSDSRQFVNDSAVTATDATAAAAAVVDAIDDYAIVLRARVIGKVSPFEAASWGLKLSEALAGGGKILKDEAKDRKVSEANIVQRVLANYSAWAAMESAISGVSGMHKDAVRALAAGDAKASAVLDYDWRSDWPL